MSTIAVPSKGFFHGLNQNVPDEAPLFAPTIGSQHDHASVFHRDVKIPLRTNEFQLWEYDAGCNTVDFGKIARAFAVAACLDPLLYLDTVNYAVKEEEGRRFVVLSGLQSPWFSSAVNWYVFNHPVGSLTMSNTVRKFQPQKTYQMRTFAQPGACHRLFPQVERILRNSIPWLGSKKIIFSDKF